MTEPEDALRGALRDLLPDYVGPADPMTRVAVGVRRRRVRQRSLLTAGAAGIAAVLALSTPLLLTGGGAAPAAAPGGAVGPVPTATGHVAPPASDPVPEPVAYGRGDGVRWAVGSAHPAPGPARRPA